MNLALTSSWRQRNDVARVVGPALLATNHLHRYEASRRVSARRSYIDPNLRDARQDLPAMDRETLAAKSQNLEANASLFTRMLDIFQIYTVGSNGFQYIPGGEDAQWAERYAEVWAEHCFRPDRGSELDMAAITNVLAREWPMNGGAVIVKTRTPTFPIQPKIQLLDYRRLRSPLDRVYDLSSRIVDGIEVDANGAPVAFHVAKDFDGETPRRIPANGIIHVWDAQRSHQYRGLPFLYSGIDELHDLKDLHFYEMGAAKEFARNAKFIKTQSGEVDIEDAANGTVASVTNEDATRYYEQSFGPETKVLRTGDEVQFPESKRPGPATQWHWETLETNACNAFGMSKLLVKPYSIQGTVARAILSVDNAFFRACSAFLASKMLQVHLHFMDWSVANDPRLKNPPKGWRNIEVQPPAAVDVDVGRNSAALIAEYEAGWRTIKEICEALGKNYRMVMRQKARELREALDLEKEFNLPQGSLVAVILKAIKDGSLSGTPKEAEAA